MKNLILMLRSLLDRTLGVLDQDRCGLVVAGRFLVLRAPSARQGKVMTNRLSGPVIEVPRC